MSQNDFIHKMTAAIACSELLANVMHELTQQAAETLAKNPKLHRSAKEFIEQKAYFFKVRDACEKFIKANNQAFKEQGEIADKPIDMCFIEVTTLSECIQAYTEALINATAQPEPQHNQMHTELLSILRKYRKLDKRKKNPDLFRTMFIQAGAQSYPCFEKGVISTYSLLNKQD